jgi:hypothetical protein
MWLKLKLGWRNQHRIWNTLARRKRLRSLAFAGRMIWLCGEQASAIPKNGHA